MERNVPSLSNCVFFAYSSMPSPHFLACSFLVGRCLTCSSTTFFACWNMEDAAPQADVVHPHPPLPLPPLPPSLEVVLSAAAAAAVTEGTMPLVFGLSIPEDVDEDNDSCFCSGIEDPPPPPPNLTLSVLFLIVGVPEREMGVLCTVDDGLLVGSDAFSWSSSRNADASPPPTPGRRFLREEEEEEEEEEEGVVAFGPTLLLTPIPTEESGEEDSRSSRSRSASWYFAMD